MIQVLRIGLIALILAVSVLPGCGDEEKGVDQRSESGNVADDDDDSGSCKWEDGTYSATVDYYNPETDFSNTYTLDVVVEDCQVIQINFPAGGWLDEDHISPADIDTDGDASVEGEDGKTYEVHLEERNGS
ncbi:MAG: hypothetical protein HYU70_13010 [Bacteroidetes bacterium]|nr:hypothetical protein [Bacteroidota bacterium]